MRTTLIGLTILFAWTLMPGLGGCADRRQPAAEEPTAQPQPLSTRPACAPAPACESANADVAIMEIADETRAPLTMQFDRQVHNRELADMSLTDLHFLPNRSMLNSNGTQRLNHLAWLVDHYGGSIKLDLEEPNGKLSQARRQTVCAYLKACGLPPSKTEVVFGLPDSKGMDAKEAIPIYNDSRYKSKQGQCSTSDNPTDGFSAMGDADAGGSGESSAQ